MPTLYSHLNCVMLQLLFQRVVISIFLDISHDYMEIYVDDFIAYGGTFEEALKNLEKVLQRCEDHNLSLNTKKCFMMMREGVVLGHYISQTSIQVDPSNIEVILNVSTLIKKKNIISFLGHAGYYKRFIKAFSNMVGLLYNLLTKDVEFQWTP